MIYHYHFLIEAESECGFCQQTLPKEPDTHTLPKDAPRHYYRIQTVRHDFHSEVDIYMQSTPSLMVLQGWWVG